MAGRIPQSFIDDLLVRTDIVELIDSRVRLKKAGKNYQACCPFITKKPLLYRQPGEAVLSLFRLWCPRQCHRLCHGVRRPGIPRCHRRAGKPARHAGPREQTAGGSSHSQPAVSKDLFELMNQIARFYESNLKNAPQAVEYLKGRGLTGEVVKRFNIGYALGTGIRCVAALAPVRITNNC